jgi:hypothetical protein
MSGHRQLLCILLSAKRMVFSSCWMCTLRDVQLHKICVAFKDFLEFGLDSWKFGSSTNLAVFWVGAAFLVHGSFGYLDSLFWLLATMSLPGLCISGFIRIWKSGVVCPLCLKPIDMYLHIVWWINSALYLFFERRMIFSSGWLCALLDVNSFVVWNYVSFYKSCKSGLVH